MAFSKVSVLVPTRGRVARLQKMLASFAATTAGHAELIFRIDDDDAETRTYLDAVPRGDLKGGVFQGPRHDGYRSTPQFLKDILPLASGDVLMVGNDDMVFETPEWDRLLIAAANKFPDGLFNLGVETLNATHFPFSVISKRVTEVLGWMYDPRIFWGDIYLRDVMAAFDRTVLIPGIRITHDWAGNAPDATFAEANDLKMSIGTADYWQQHAVVVSEAVEKLRSAIVGVAA